MRLGFVEPHLRCFGGIRRMIEFANRLTARGHQVTFYLPDDAELRCDWMQCDAMIAPLTSGFDAQLDVVLFNSEPQWHLIERFEHARRRLFYALHYACLYNKEGSWESLRVPVDLQLANSNWTADQIFRETGYRPVVQLGGVNRETFHPYSLSKNAALLTNGEKHRSWKGTDTVLAAARLADVRVAMYAGKNLDQRELGRRYARARVFAVGSWFEGFCQPGLEALACGTPLVTTDNGGCREYAIDGETALVVPPRDAPAMADAIRRLLDDPALARRLAENGLEIVARDFDWERRTDEFEMVLDGLCAGRAGAPPPVAPKYDDPELSLIIRAGDDLRETQRFMEAARRYTDVPFEVVIVDTSAGWEAENYARNAADRTVRADASSGYGRVVSVGLEAAQGAYAAFCTGVAALGPGWASRLLATAREYERAAIVVPSTTAEDGRSAARDIEVLPPFSEAPSEGVYLVRVDLLARLGGWDGDYETAAGANLDLCFRAWVRDLDVIRDARVHAPGSEPDEPSPRRERDRRRFLDTWNRVDYTAMDASCEPPRFTRNREIARAAAEWMERYWALQDREYQRSRKLLRRNSPILRKLEDSAHGVWRWVRPRLPANVADRLGAFARRRGTNGREEIS